MGQVVAVLVVYVHGEAGAVKALGGGAAVDIAGAQILLGGGHDVRAEAAAGHAVVDPEVIGGDVAQLAVDGNGVPAVLKGDQIHQAAAVHLRKYHAVSGGKAADIDTVAGDDALGIHQGDTVDGDIIGLHKAVEAVIADLAPLVGHIDDRQLIAGPDLGQNVHVLHFRLGTEVDHAAGDDAHFAGHTLHVKGGGGNAFHGLEADVGGVDITGGAVAADLVPLAQVLKHFHLGAGAEICNGGGGGGGFAAQAQGVGVDRSDLTYSGGKGGHCQDRGGQHRQHKYFIPQLFHWYSPRVFSLVWVRFIAGALQGHRLLSGQSPLQPDGGDIHRGVEAVLLAALDHTVPALQVGPGALKLHGNLCCDLQILFLSGFLDLHQDNMGIGHGAVINHLAYPAQGMLAVNQTLCLVCHPVTSFLNLVLKIGLSLFVTEL